MKTPSVLKYAGYLGHGFAVTAPAAIKDDLDRRRYPEGVRVVAECSTLRTARLTAREYKGSRVWQRTGTQWKRIAKR